jgi:hypothetical protein
VFALAVVACGGGDGALAGPTAPRPSDRPTHAALAAGQAVGQAYRYVGSGRDQQLWTDPANWSPAGVPGDGDTVTVARRPSGPSELIVPRPIALGGLVVGEGGRIRGDSVAVTGRMTWSGGDVMTPLRIAAGAGAEVVGPDDKTLYPPGLTNAGTIVVRGPGRLRLWGDADVTNAGLFQLEATTAAPAVTVTSSRCCVSPSAFVNTGTLAVTGMDTLGLLRLVNRGTVRIASGSVLSLDRGLYELHPGTRLAGGGRLRVSGSEDSLGLAQAVGLEDASTLELAASSRLRGVTAASGTGTIDWTGGSVEGTLSVASDTRLRIRGPGLKRLSAGAGGAGVINSAGAAVWTDTGSVGLAGSALLNSTGTLDVRSDVRMFAYNCCTAPARVVNAGRLTKSGGDGRSELRGIYFANRGTVTLRRGTLAFGTGGGEYAQEAGDTYLVGGHLASVTPVRLAGGTLRGGGIVTGSLVNAGAVRPGPGPDGLRITGDYTQTAAGLLELQIGGRTAGTTYDRLRVGGVARLDGVASVLWANGFQPAAADAFGVLEYGSRAGQFRDVRGLAFSPDLTFGLALGGTAGVIRQ